MTRETKSKRKQAEIDLRKNPINDFTCCGRVVVKITVKDKT